MKKKKEKIAYRFTEKEWKDEYKRIFNYGRREEKRETEKKVKEVIEHLGLYDIFEQRKENYNY